MSPAQELAAACAENVMLRAENARLRKLPPTVAQVESWLRALATIKAEAVDVPNVQRWALAYADELRGVISARAALLSGNQHGASAETDRKPREPGCECDAEEGDSPCPVHGEEENAPAPASLAEVAPIREQIVALVGEVSFHKREDEKQARKLRDKDPVLAARYAGSAGAAKSMLDRLANLLTADKGPASDKRAEGVNSFHCCGGNDQQTSHTMDCSEKPGQPRGRS